MEKTWIIAEQLQNCSFRIVSVVKSEQEPVDEYRKGVIKTYKFYEGKMIPKNVVCLFMLFDEEGSQILAKASQDDILAVFEQLKSEGRTSCNDTVSIHRSAWCYINGIDPLKYSYQNEGGRESKYLPIVGNINFQVFRTEKCEIDGYSKTKKRLR